MIAYISISTQEHEDSFSLRSEPELLIRALRMYQGFLIEKTETYQGWREVNEMESQIAEQLIRRVENAAIKKMELLPN